MVGCKKEINTIKSTMEMLVDSQDEYSIGLYNGMEYSLSILENRKPKYLVVVGETKQKEEIQEVRRTVKSGIKRRS